MEVAGGWGVEVGGVDWAPLLLFGMMKRFWRWIVVMAAHDCKSA